MLGEKMWKGRGKGRPGCGRGVAGVRQECGRGVAGVRQGCGRDVAYKLLPIDLFA